VRAAFERGAITSFARHSRLGGTEHRDIDQVREAFLGEVGRLRELGFARLTLKTGAYGMEGLAMAIRFAADAGLDLLTIDGSGGGTGMSPWNMMDHWGVPSLPLHAKAYDYCRILTERGIDPPQLALAGGLAREDHVFKALALCAPFARLVCLGRALMIPAFLGSNLEGVFHPERRAAVHGHWDHLPSTVKAIGERAETVLAGWEATRQRVGEAEMARIPYGAIALYGYADKLACGLQQLMAGARKFSLDQLGREDLMAANRETAEVTGIPFLTEAQDERALAILRT
jgi:glutamate synthase domain-containing protein 2